MRPAQRVRTAAVASLALLGALAGAGCTTIDDTRQVLNRADLVNELAAQLDRASQLTYTAQYQLASGQTATIVQARRPTRSAYIYPGGKVVISSTATTECRMQGGDSHCTLTPPPLSTSGPPADVLADASAQGLVYPAVVMGLLTNAALDRGALIDQSDTTVAGQHASCVDVRQAEQVPPFKACITTEGVLGSFAGTVDGRRTEVSLISYSETAAESAFDLPPGARISDQRRR
ncbi:MAG: hypothetical protein IRZ05_04590 [Micromonosporaceae bacterium]|jgi:hypothetical protein|nr:hypothetical protein [Micromonosporaceae bacterium]